MHQASPTWEEEGWVVVVLLLLVLVLLVGGPPVAGADRCEAAAFRCVPLLL